MSDIGNSNRIAREYLDLLWIETRYMDSDNPILDPTRRKPWRKGRRKPGRSCGTGWRRKKRLNGWRLTAGR